MIYENLYNYRGNKVRTLRKESFFVYDDIVKILGIENPDEVFYSLDKDYDRAEAILDGNFSRFLKILRKKYRDKLTTKLITKPGVYSLIFNSGNKKEAKAFKDWLESNPDFVRVALFNYRGNKLRTCACGDIFFFFEDVCKILGIQNPNEKFSRLDEIDRAFIPFEIDGEKIPFEDFTDGKIKVVNLSGLNSLLLSCDNKKEVQAFNEWVQLRGYTYKDSGFFFLPTFGTDTYIIEEDRFRSNRY